MNKEVPALCKFEQTAKEECWFSHLAFEILGENTSNEWLEPVTDEAYNRLSEEQK